MIINGKAVIKKLRALKRGCPSLAIIDTVIALLLLHQIKWQSFDKLVWEKDRKLLYLSPVGQIYSGEFDQGHDGEKLIVIDCMRQLFTDDVGQGWKWMYRFF